MTAHRRSRGHAAGRCCSVNGGHPVTRETMTDETTVCAVCGIPLPTDAAAIAHLNEALDMERIAARNRAPQPRARTATR